MFTGTPKSDVVTMAKRSKSRGCHMTRVKSTGMRCRCGNKFAKRSRCK